VAPGTSIVEGLENQRTAAAVGFLEGKRRVKDMPAITRTLAFAHHLYPSTALQTTICGQNYFEIEIPGQLSKTV